MSSGNTKNVLITGASSGIGRELAILLSKFNYRCVLVSRKESELLETLKCMTDQESHLIIPYDLTDFENYDHIFKKIQSSGIILNGLVHCAGVARAIPLRASGYNNSSMEMFALHYFAFVELVKWYAKKGMSQGGSIVGISAINAHVPQKCMTAYAASKSAMESACRTLALELADKNIRINSIVVGGIKTKMGEDVDTIKEKMKSTYENPVSRQLLGIGTAKDIIPVIKFLLDDDSAFITGRDIYVDGGLL